MSLPDFEKMAKKWLGAELDQAQAQGKTTGKLDLAPLARHAYAEGLERAVNIYNSKCPRDAFSPTVNNALHWAARQARQEDPK